MNAIDAGAKKIEVEIRSSEVIISDDGKGFTKEAVTEYFECFGAEHDLDEEGISRDARFGTFRIGRGQLFAYGRNSWRTNTMQMDVDIQEKGPSYTWTTGLPNRKGCEVQVELYEALSLTEIRQTIDEVTKFCRYVEHDLIVNGEKVSVDPAQEKWDIVSPQAYIRKKPELNRWNGEGLAIYQQGIFVETISSSTYGLSGTIVIRQPIVLNTSRNMVIRTRAGWKKIAAMLTQEGIRDAITKKAQLKPWEARNFVEKMADTDAISYNEFAGTACLPDVTGKLWSVDQFKLLLRSRAKNPKILRGPMGEIRIGFAPKGDLTGDRVMQLKRAVVLDEALFEQFRIDRRFSYEEKGEAVLDIFRNKRGENEYGFVYDRFHGQLVLIRPEELLEDKRDDKFTLVDQDDWTPTEVMVMDAAQSVLWGLHRTGFVDRRPARKLLLGESVMADGWTDGRSYIAINRSYLKDKDWGCPKAWFQLALLICHEDSHDAPDTDTHVHSPEFYEAFHDLSDTAAQCAWWAYQTYRKKLFHKNKKLSKAILHRLHQEAETYASAQLHSEQENE